MSTRIDYSGSKFNHLTLVKYARSGGKGRGAIWLARCDCGTTKEVVAKDIAKGRVKTCGKCDYTRRLMVENRTPSARTSSPKKKLYARYISKALEKGHIWELTLQEFHEITRKPCIYCDVAPYKKIKRAKFLYNGIDLLDRDKGYTLDNSVPCCSKCNRMKGPLNYLEFLEIVVQIYETIRKSLDTRK